MDDLKLFVPMTKIDAARRLVYGVVTAETPDVAGEVCDYATTKPQYEKWSRKFASATDGRSLGNLRAMHSHVAAGKLIEIAFNDADKRIEICGKVIDDAEWQKVEEGVYTGFSQGGRYLKRWPDPERPELTRYTAEPLEVSLVDHPCLPQATFTVVKADGSTELRKFKAAGDTAETTLGKIGARHSKVDKARIKQSHDLLVALDPDCCPGAHVPGAHVEPQPQFSPQAGEGATAGGGDEGDDGDAAAAQKLAKLVDRSVGRAVQVSLEKTLAGIDRRFDALGAQFKDVAARLKKLEDQPLPLGTSSVRVADKREDAPLPQAEHLLDRPGALEALAEAAIRRAQASPMRTIPGAKPAQRS